MGIGAVKSHMKSKQHNQIMKHKQSPYTQSITDFFGGTNKSVPTTNESGKLVSSSVTIPEQTSNVSSVPVSSAERKCCMQKFFGLLKKSLVTTHLVLAKMLAVYFL